MPGFISSNSTAEPAFMTPGLGFALGAMLCFGAGDLIYKRAAAAGIEASQFVMLQAWVFCPGITLYAWLTGTLDPQPSALWGGLAGLCALVALYQFRRQPASRRGEHQCADLPAELHDHRRPGDRAAGRDADDDETRGARLRARRGVAAACRAWRRARAAASWQVVDARADRNRRDGSRQLVLQGRPATRRAAGNHGRGAGLGVLLDGDAVRLAAANGASS